jgi:hypothetical protein
MCNSGHNERHKVESRGVSIEHRRIPMIMLASSGFVPAKRMVTAGRGLAHYV